MVIPYEGVKSDYNGQIFESYLETLFAEFCFILNWQYLYEPFTHYCTDEPDRVYRPDFIVCRYSDPNCTPLWCEIKPTRERANDAKTRTEAVWCEHPEAELVTAVPVSEYPFFQYNSRRAKTPPAAFIFNNYNPYQIFLQKPLPRHWYDYTTEEAREQQSWQTALQSYEPLILPRALSPEDFKSGAPFQTRRQGPYLHAVATYLIERNHPKDETKRLLLSFSQEDFYIQIEKKRQQGYINGIVERVASKQQRRVNDTEAIRRIFTFENLYNKATRGY